MATTSFGLNDALSVKLWSKDLARAERETLELQALMGEDSNSIIQVKPETAKGAGDKVTFGLRARLSQDGISSSEVAEGNGEALSIYSDSIVIDELGGNVGVKSENTIDAQRVPFSLRAEAKAGLAEWWADRKSASFFNQVCGYTPANTVAVGSGGPKYTGLNTVVAPAATRRIVAGSGTTDDGLSSSDIFTLSLIDQAVEMAKVGNNMVRPIMIKGQKKYVVYLHPYQVTSLRTNTSTGQWLDIQKAAMAGMDSKASPIYTGAVGEHNGCILRVSQDVTQGVHSSTGAAVTTVRRAVLLGAQAAVCAYGKQSGASGRYRWNEELFDHKRKLEVSAWSIWGLKKTVFNSVDFGCVVISSYAAAAS
jgi:N4-gp56 family major capsid protein